MLKHVVALSLCALPLNAMAWGNFGHRIVGKVATVVAEEGELFWSANEAPIAAFSNTPDVLWKRGSSSRGEQPTHWFHFDVYSPGGSPLPTLFESYEAVVREYSERDVVENGTGIWRVEQFFLEARESLAKGRFEEALQWAGAMSHYVGDLSQPLHVTQNYNGQLTGQTGIHAWFETTNLQKTAGSALEERVTKKARALLATPSYRAQFEGGVMKGVLMLAKRSVELTDDVLDTDARLGRGAQGSVEQLAIAEDRLADGAASYALLLSRLWKEGGQKDTGRKLTPAQPSWKAPDYSRREGTARGAIEERAEGEFQDCL